MAVTSEQQLAEAIRNREPYIRLTGHIVLTGNYANGTNLLPELQVPTTITVRGAARLGFSGKAVKRGMALHSMA